jgi:molecular chaperone DnaJ
VEACQGCEKTLSIPRLTRCETCGGKGAKPGTTPQTCPQCNGSGQMRFQQGFFSIAKTCGKCNGHGQIVTNPCVTCDGAGARRVTYTVNVKIPAGVDAGSRLKLRGEGEVGDNGGPSGDLYVVLDVEEHTIFTREGTDLVCEVPVSIAQAALGTEIEVPTLDGSAKVKVPAGTQSGQMFRLRGRGVADLGGYGKGDELVRIVVETPKKLTARQRELLEEFARIAGEDVHPMSKSFLDKVKSMLG